MLMSDLKELYSWSKEKSVKYEFTPDRSLSG
jgi:hypothetical protein